MGYTAIEKIMSRASNHEGLRAGDQTIVTPAFYLSHDNSGDIIGILDEIRKEAEEQIKEVLKSREDEQYDKDTSIILPETLRRPEKAVIIFDHMVGSDNPAHFEYHDITRAFVKAYDGRIHFYDDKAGVCHQVFVEEGFAQPGSLVIGSDSHTTLHGAANAAGIPINRTEMAGVWRNDSIGLRVPETIRINLEGELRRGVYSKDIVFHLLQTMGSNGANYKALEFGGTGIANLSMSERMTITNMAIELGAKTATMPYDNILEEYLARTTRRTNPNPVQADNDAIYYQKISVELSELEAMVAVPHNPENIRRISELGNIPVTQAYLGSCTNGRYEDLEVAARILKGNRVHPNVHLMVYPASKRVEDMAKETGIYKTLERAGAVWMTASCGPCFGAVGPTLKDGDTCISSSNRNFRGRMGSRQSSIYLGSPATVAASAIAGRIISEEEL